MLLLQWVLGFLLGQKPIAAPCPQWDALYPRDHAALVMELENTYASQDFRLRTFDALSGVVQFP